MRSVIIMIWRRRILLPCCGDAVCALPTGRLRCTPTAATRSPRCICHRQRSGHSPDFHWLRQFKSVPANKKSAIPVGMTDFLELLARFELATSSLPTILEAVLPCASYRKLLDKTLVYQRLFGFACCSLLWLAVGVLCRFFMTRVGFVSVSTPA